MRRPTIQASWQLLVSSTLVRERTGHKPCTGSDANQTADCSRCRSNGGGVPARPQLEDHPTAVRTRRRGEIEVKRIKIHTSRLKTGAKGFMASHTHVTMPNPAPMVVLARATAATASGVSAEPAGKSAAARLRDEREQKWGSRGGETCVGGGGDLEPNAPLPTHRS